MPEKFNMFVNLMCKLRVETIRPNGNEYKHIFIYMNNGKFTMRLKAGEEIDVNEYKL